MGDGLDSIYLAFAQNMVLESSGMNRYRKLIVAVVGLGLLLLNRHAGIDLAAQETAIVDLTIAILTASGVYQVPNQSPGDFQ